MSKANGSIKTTLDNKSAIKAIRRAGSSFGSLIEKRIGFYEIKDNVQRTNWSTTWPATTEIRVTPSDVGNDTVILLYSHNFGFGPIQRKECESKLGAIKAAIEDEFEKIERENKASLNDNMEALLKLKRLLDVGAITQEEYNTKKKQLLWL